MPALVPCLAPCRQPAACTSVHAHNHSAQVEALHHKLSLQAQVASHLHASFACCQDADLPVAVSASQAFLPCSPTHILSSCLWTQLVPALHAVADSVEPMQTQLASPVSSNQALPRLNSTTVRLPQFKSLDSSPGQIPILAPPPAGAPGPSSAKLHHALSGTLCGHVFLVPLLLH